MTEVIDITEAKSRRAPACMAGRDRWPSPKQPLPVAREFIRRRYTHTVTLEGAAPRSVPTIGRWRGDWYRWCGTHWRTLSVDDVDLGLYEALEHAVYPVLDDEGQEVGEADWNPTTARVANVRGALHAVAHGTLSDDLDAPFWTDGYDDTAPAREHVAMGNGVLHIPTGTLHGPDPELFTTWSLPFDYDQAAECPRWERFIGEVFAHDEKGGEFLREWIGYLVSGRTDMHAAAVIIGPPGAGKGTTSRVIKRLVGPENTVSPSLNSLTQQFGLAALVGKPVGIVEDMGTAGPSGSALAVERILNITGEDQLMIDRKNREHWSGTLPTRLTMFGNETPRLTNPSGALWRRLISVRLERSFAGREDRGLDRALTAELPGIFNWALEGLERLTANRRFTTPDTHADMAEAMKESQAPAHAFLHDIYEVTGDTGHYVEVSGPHGVLEAYRRWCDETGRRPVGRDALATQINAACIPGVAAKNSSTVKPGKKVRVVFGISAQSGAREQPEPTEPVPEPLRNR